MDTCSWNGAANIKQPTKTLFKRIINYYNNVFYIRTFFVL